MHLIVVNFEVSRLQIPDRALWISCSFPRFAAGFASAKANISNSCEEGFCLSPQCRVESDEEERVDEAVRAAKVECARVVFAVPLDAQIDHGGPPAKKEGQREEGEDKGCVVPPRLHPLLALPDLVQDQPIADEDDQCGNDENCYTRPEDPSLTFHWH